MKIYVAALGLALALFSVPAFAADAPAPADAAKAKAPAATPAPAPADAAKPQAAPAAPAPAAAPAPEDPNKAKVAAMATSYQRYATELGYPVFAGGSIGKTGHIYTLNYLKSGDAMNTAKSMVIITVYQLSGDKDKDDATMASTITMLRNFYLQPTNTVDDKIVMNTLDEKTWFTQFTTGHDESTVYNAAAYLRTNTKPSEAAFITLKSRPIIAPQQALMIYQLVNPQAQLPVKKKAGKTGWESDKGTQDGLQSLTR